MLYVVDNSHSDKWIHFMVKIESVLPKIMFKWLVHSYDNLRLLITEPGTYYFFAELCFYYGKLLVKFSLYF